MHLVDISFPGLGIDTFTVNKVAFELFGVEVRWYGLLITLGMVLAFLYAIYRSRQEGFTSDDVYSMGLFMVIFGVIGARVYYVLMKLDTYILPGRSFWETLKAMCNIRAGGLAIYGGIIAGAATLIIYCRVKKRSWRRALDMVAPGVMIAQALGRWGNFFNGEAYGGIVSEESPLYFLRMGLSPNDLNDGVAYVHPTFLYESMWNVLGFILINALLYRRKKFDGQIALTYFAWYGFGRMFIEGLRTDSLYIGDFRVSQVVGFLCFVAGTLFIAVMLIRIRKKERAASAGEYQPVFAGTATDATDDTVSAGKKETAEQENTATPAAPVEPTEPTTEDAENGKDH